MYLHEFALKNAVKKLHMLGHSDQPEGSGLVDIGEGMASAGTAMVKGKLSQGQKDAMYKAARERLELRKAQEAHVKDLEEQARIGKQYGPEGMDVRNGMAVPHAADPQAWNQAQNVRNGTAVPSAPMGPNWQALADKADMHDAATKLGPQGTGQMIEHSDDIAHDMLYGRNLIGMAGTPAQPMLNQPPSLNPPLGTR